MGTTPIRPRADEARTVLKTEMRFNGRKIAAGSQLQCGLSKAVEKHAEASLKRAAGPKSAGIDLAAAHAPI